MAEYNFRKVGVVGSSPIRGFLHKNIYILLVNIFLYEIYNYLITDIDSNVNSN